MTKSDKIKWTLKTLKLSDLTDYYKNPRQITEKEFKQLRTSLEKFGMIDKPIVNADAANTVIGGHQRKHVLEDGGVTECECWVPDRELTEREVEELNVRLNRNVASWDFDILANEFELDDLLDWGFEEGKLFGNGFDEPETNAGADAEPQINIADELREKWGVESGQLWQLGEHRIVCGDCTDKAVVDRLMSSERADAVITDPPYNVSYSSLGSNTESWGKIENDEMSDEDFYLWLLKVGKSINYVLKNGAAIYLCHGDTDRKSIPFIDIFRDIGWKRSSTIIWAKQAASMGWQDYRSQHECLSYGWKEGSEHFFVNDRTQTTVWQIDRDASSKYLHPTQKPVELFEKAINNSSKAGDLVFEPFSGSGTTIIACENLKRKCRAVEISPNYVAVAIQRWADLTGGTPELVDD